VITVWVSVAVQTAGIGMLFQAFAVDGDRFAEAAEVRRAAAEPDPVVFARIDVEILEGVLVAFHGRRGRGRGNKRTAEQRNRFIGLRGEGGGGGIRLTGRAGRRSEADNQKGRGPSEHAFHRDSPSRPPGRFLQARFFA